MTDFGQPGGSGDPPVSDDALWNRVRDGDEQALGELFDRYADEVHAFAFRRTASWSIAEDVVQTTFVSTWQRLTQRDDERRMSEVRRALANGRPIKLG
ncbi:RNA polymerase sigma factor [Kribbella deserti]|uniref:RNA polymerase sigma factor n=1 Tax=Kribbella deserti TaxID=1926257 RepID=A0ABV6QMU9_9ACTN